MEKPYYEESGIVLYHGDSNEILKNMERNESTRIPAINKLSNLFIYVSPFKTTYIVSYIIIIPNCFIQKKFYS